MVELPQALLTEPHATPEHDGAGHTHAFPEHTSSTPLHVPQLTERLTPQRSLTVMEPHTAALSVQSS